MPRMNLVVNLRDKRRRSPRNRWSIKRLFHGIRQAWTEFTASMTLPLPPDTPEPSPPLAKATALREGALLFEYVDAQSNKNVA